MESLMKWFRFYHDAIDDPKVQRLPGDLFKFWVNVLCLASRSDERGVVKLELGEIAFALRLSDEATEAMASELVARNLLEETTSGLQIHNWDSRQFRSDNVTERVMKHRSKAESVPDDVSETLDETLHETLKPSVNTDYRDTDTEEKRVGGANAPTTAPAPDEPAKPKSKRGSRIPADFSITDDMRQWAIERGASAVQVEHETEKFVNYWTGESGAKASKLDWCAAWKVWVGRNLPASRSQNGTLTVHHGGRKDDPAEVSRAAWRRKHNIPEPGTTYAPEDDDVIDVKGIAR